MKKAISILLVLLLVFALAGCQPAGENPSAPEPPTTTPIETPTPPSAEPVRFFVEPDAFTSQTIAGKESLGGKSIVDVKTMAARMF